MVVLVLNKFRKIAAEIPLVLLPLEVAIGKPARMVSFQSNQKVRETHAVIPQLDHSVAQMRQLRVYDGYRFVDMQNDQAFQDTDLRCGNGPAGPVLTAKLKYEVGQVFDQWFKGGRFFRGYRGAWFVEPWVP